MTEYTDTRDRRSWWRVVLGAMVVLVVLLLVASLAMNIYARKSYDAVVARLADKGIRVTMAAIEADIMSPAVGEDPMEVYREAADAAFTEKIALCSKQGGTWQCVLYTQRTDEQDLELLALNNELSAWQERVLAASSLDAIGIRWVEEQNSPGQSQDDVDALRRAMKYLGNQAYGAVLADDPEGVYRWAHAQAGVLNQSDALLFLLGGINRVPMARVFLDALQASLEKQVWPRDDLEAMDVLLANAELEAIVLEAFVSEAGYAIALTKEADEIPWSMGFGSYREYSQLLALYDSVLIHEEGRLAFDRKAFNATMMNSDSQPIMVGLLAPALLNLVDAVDALVIRRDLMRLAIGLERYKAEGGAYPDSLADIRQSLLNVASLAPHDASPYGYVREGDGFVLSCMGPHEKAIRVAISD